MGFTQDCINDSLPIWEKCLHSDFVRGVADGTLNEECFKGYIVDDSLYLREYAKVFAWGMIHAADMEEIRMYYSMLSFVNESEDLTRQYYLQRYGLRDSDIHKLPLRAQNRAYADSMLEAAKNADGAAECMMAALPCMLSYGWIFRQVLAQHPKAADTVYGRFVNDYAGDDYDAQCRKWIELADKYCADLSPNRKKKCMDIFRACSEHELHFWEMSAEPRADV